MANLWSLFYHTPITSEMYKEYDQDDVDAAIIQELQFHIDEVTKKQIEKILREIKEVR